MIHGNGHMQKAVLLSLLEHGVGGVSSIAAAANTTTASVFNALSRLLQDGLIAVAPEALQDDSYRKGARQYGLTQAGIDAALELEGTKV